MMQDRLRDNIRQLIRYNNNEKHTTAILNDLLCIKPVHLKCL